MEEGRNGVTKQTPEHIPFGAGTIHKGLKYTKDSGWNFAETLVGATNGGSKFEVIPELHDVQLDGVTVPLKEGKHKLGETAIMEVNFAELTEEIIKAATLAVDGVSEDELYNLIESKSDIVEGDFWDNISFVGKTLKGRNIIAILPNALCISGMSHEGKNKEASVGAYTFACHASIEDVALDRLPWKIYYPKPVA